MSKINDLKLNQDKLNAELTQKDNSLKQLISSENLLKQSILIQETDWEILSASISPSDKRVDNNGYLPLTYTLNQLINCLIPDQFLPYLKIDFLFKTPKDTELVGILSYQQQGYSGDYIESYGDGNLIYKGTPYPVYHLYSQSDIDNGDLSESFTKRIYRAVLEYTQGGNQYRVDGTLGAVSLIENVGSTPGGNVDQDIWNIDIDPGYLTSKNYAKIISLSNTNISAYSQYDAYRWVTNPFPPPAENPTNTYTDNVLISKSFGSLDDEIYRIQSATRYKKVGLNWVFDSSGNFTIQKSLVTSFTRSFNFLGFWLFYSSDTRYLFGVGDFFPTTPDGDYNLLELKNLPQKVGLDDYRIWNNISFLRFPSPYPIVNSVNVTSISEQQQFIIKKDINSYLLNISEIIKLKIVPTVIQNLHYPKYNDVYSKDAGTSYTRFSSHSIQDLEYYRPDFQDIQYKIRIALNLPSGMYQARHHYDI